MEMLRKLLLPILVYGFLMLASTAKANVSLPITFTHTDGATYSFVGVHNSPNDQVVTTIVTTDKIDTVWSNNFKTKQDKGKLVPDKNCYVVINRYINVDTITNVYDGVAYGKAELKSVPASAIQDGTYTIPSHISYSYPFQGDVIEDNVTYSETYPSGDTTIYYNGVEVFFELSDKHNVSYHNYVGSYTKSTIGTEIQIDIVSSIGDYAFTASHSNDGKNVTGLTGLTSIVIPAAIESIGQSAFQGCTNLANLTFMTPGSLKTIGTQAFFNCTHLCDVYVPASVNHLGWRVFSGCDSLSISFEPNSQLISIANDAVTQRNTSFTEYESGYIDEMEKAPSNGVFKGTTVKYLTLPDNLTALPAGEFQENTHLKSIYIPGNVEVIGPDCFLKSGLCTIEFETPSKLATIGYHAFGHLVKNDEGCSLTSIDIPASVREIQGKAFHAASTLAEVTFNRTVTNSAAGGEVDIYFGYNSPEGASTTPFDGVSSSVKYTVPCGMTNSYMLANRPTTDNTKTPTVNRSPCTSASLVEEKGFEFNVKVHGVEGTYTGKGYDVENSTVKTTDYSINNCEGLYLTAIDQNYSRFSRWYDKTHDIESKSRSIVVDMDNKIYLTAYFNLELEPGVNYSSLTKTNSLCDTLIIMGNNNTVATFDASTYSLKANAIKIKRTFDATKFYYFSLPFDCKGSDIEVVDETLQDVKSKYDSDESYTIGTDKWIIYQYNESSLSGGAQFEDGASYTAVSNINNFTFRRGIGYAIGVICAENDDEANRKVTITFPCSAEQALTLTGFNQDIEIEEGLSVTKTGSDERYYGWNLVGSPSLKEIPASNFLQAGWGDNVAYFSFLTGHNRYSQVKAAGDSTVHPFRPFFLQLSEPSIVVLASNSIPMFAPANGNRYEDRQIVITLSNDFERYDETTLLADEEAADGYVINEDLAKLFSQGIPSIYSYWEGYEYAFNKMNFANVHREIPLGVKVYEQGQYTIALDNDKSNFGDVVYLNDTKLNKRVNLLKNRYRVSLNPGDDNGRFILEIDYVPTGVADVDEETGVMAYVTDDRLRVENIADESMVSVYDMAGRLVVSRYADGSFECELPMRGAYIVKVVSDNSSNSVKVIY